jgi:hypothetical protein
MTLPPSRAEILAALQDPNPHPLADRVADALDALARSFSDEAARGGSLEHIRLPAPTNEVEGVALELFMQQVREEMPHANITIRGDS